MDLEVMLIFSLYYSGTVVGRGDDDDDDDNIGMDPAPNAAIL
jgi:hypothetical protein